MQAPRRFSYLPPAHEEQRAFVVQFVGSLLGLAIVGLLIAGRVKLLPLGVPWGIGAGIVYLLARSAWKLELKAQRSMRAGLEVSDESLHIVDRFGKAQSVAWTDLTDVGVVGGRLKIEWPSGKLEVGAREIEDGIDFLNAVMQHSGRATPQRPSNYISLEPR